ncbi:Disease resistance protein RGA2 [Rhynchospora pubera]|uniref:Disease resistance protein RGA2 n=1 Tax=Rhynchospora pubera TaxID=906938 RepID=A0AAV8GT62_9POAL|nr:Disease resistance protein RGA2 [Rhynchospora pubera]
MHDVLRSFARYLKGNSFITREGELLCRREPMLKLRRLSIEGPVVDQEFLKKQKSLRTLLLVDNLVSDFSDFLSNVLLSFTCLRTLDLCKSNISSLPDSFCGLTHLRFLDVARTKLKILPDSIGNLRKLVYLNLGSCKMLFVIPSCIVNLLELRFLNLYDTNIKVLPVGLRNLEKLVELYGFKLYKTSSEGHGSLEDLETMSQLSKLELCSLENVFDITVAKKANLKGKINRKELIFYYTLIQGCQVPKPFEEKKAALDILNALLPPPSLEILKIKGYFGHELPNWLHVGKGLSKLENLRFLELVECECFSELPSFGELPNLDYLRIKGAISVIKIGQEFLLNKDHTRTEVSHSSILPFPKLDELEFHGMPHWAEWMWEEEQPAMPKLKKLFIEACPELSSLPKGFLQHATSLEFLDINAVEQIKSLENIQSVKDIRVFDNTNLERISNLPNLSFILISNCPSLKILENLKPFHKMELWDLQMETLPEYLRMAVPEKLRVWCMKKLILKITSPEEGTSEWQKFKHINVVKIYSYDESLYAIYQKSPFSFTTNVDSNSE